MDPPFVVDNTGEPVPPAPNIGVAKSPAIPTAIPVASLTVTVHETTSLTRTIVVSPVTDPAQDRTELAVGDEIRIVYGLPVSILLETVISDIVNVPCEEVGAVKKKEKSEPPLSSVSAGVPVAVVDVS
jgi:hypothetical protein